MKAFIADESARAYWDTVRDIDSATSRCRITSVSDAAASIESLQPLAIPRAALVDRTLHLLVGEAAERRNSRHVTCHVCGVELPSGAFRRVKEGVVIVSPEYLFVRMAAKLSFAELVKLGDELCGTYAIDPPDPARADRLPLTTIRKLASFMARASRIPGVPQARKALAHIVEASNSPMETVLEMLLCLPCRHGGYGIPKPVMNRKVELAGVDAIRAGHAYFKCDLYWESQRYALEYYGREWHTGADEVANDARREGDLQYHGVDMLVVTYEQVNTPEQVGILAMKVARQLGRRFSNKPTDKCAAARVRLHAELLPWTVEHPQLSRGSSG